MILYHGTTACNADSICKTGKIMDGVLRCANDPGIAAGYGECVLVIMISESAKISAYPLRSGYLEHMLFLQDEPAEVEIEVSECTAKRLSLA